ncbi:amidohydrolase family protein [Glycomyces algeriensis]|uniref:Amidohydrolase n=1 Tax=Glycomyces algeriensis TaxID=256037 RepID=A0A9W6G5W3_9ACTN|nr:amidohydrolase family protein [Glycomyces algeriensis]MDA1368962.1 amidohydrolase family protein [Glycomyces algeriensis]MDR7353295.1 L-fuconolactonase [Glycomyces algeriensis]GLI40991.1 amidohydrolase [Glycomyces algeriensis]
MSAPQVIDAHHHVWTADYPWLSAPELAPIRRDYGVADLRANLKAAGVDRTVLVEADWGHPSETIEFLHLAGAVEEIAGVVGFIDLLDPHLAGTLARYANHPRARFLVGLRDQVQGRPDPDFLARPEVIAALRRIAGTVPTFDLIVRVDQLPAAAEAAAAVPELQFVLDHLGKPQVRDGDAGLLAWREAVAPLAKQPNVTAKLSGLVTEADWRHWTPADLRPFTQAALELFGPDRLMFGSDWPVCELAATYTRVKDALTEVLGRTDPDVFGGTAARTYHLGEQ